MAVSGNFAREGLKELILHRMVSPFHELLGFTDSGSDKVEWISTNAGTPRARMWCSAELHKAELDGCLRHLCDHRDSNLLGRDIALTIIRKITSPSVSLLIHGTISATWPNQ